MRVVLFCGGMGTRIREYNESVPKPMVPVAGQPILWRLMSYYSYFGHDDFVLCLGYKANVIKEFFLERRHQAFNDMVLSNNEVKTLGPSPNEWRVALLDTGVWRNIGGRLWAVRDHVRDERMFMANYSDAVCDVDLNQMVELFKASGKIACFLAVRAPTTYHFADIAADGRVRGFRTANQQDMWINGGFFIMRPEIFDYMNEGEDLIDAPFSRLIADDQLLAVKHHGFFRPMDTLRDRQVLEDMAEQGHMPWRPWDDLVRQPAAKGL